MSVPIPSGTVPSSAIGTREYTFDLKLTPTPAEVQPAGVNVPITVNVPISASLSLSSTLANRQYTFALKLNLHLQPAISVIATGIHKNNAVVSKLNVYPNPAMDLVNIFYPRTIESVTLYQTSRSKVDMNATCVSNGLFKFEHKRFGKRSLYS